MLAKKIVSIDIDKKNPNHHQQKSNIDQHRQKKSVIVCQKLVMVNVSKK